MSFINELKRRNVIRMAGLYLVGAWLVTQVAGTVLPMFGAPGWVPRTIVMVLAIGFIPALAFAWIFEMTPDGIKRDDEVAPGQSIASHTARRMNRLIVAGLMLAIVYFGFDKFVLTPQRAAAQAAGVAATAAKSTSPSDNRSIAVLPFVNMSSDREQEYFSDGISEEILNALAKVDGLKVAGRTSSFFFKGKNENLTMIGNTLGVAHVLEGSVRKQGEKVRITAQLIRTKDGFHLWSETYDGDLQDVFALQERIARAISDALKVALNDAQKTQLVDVGTTDAKAYAIYLEATAAYRRRDSELYPEAIGKLEQALELDPRFARAAALIGLMQASLASSKAIDHPAAIEARRRAEQAIALDPRLAEPHVTLGQIEMRQRRWLDARREFDRALALAPSDTEASFYQARNLLHTGYLAAGTAALDRLLLLDPAHPNALWRRALAYVYAGDLAAAEPALRRAHDQGLSWSASAALELARARRDWPATRQLAAAYYPTYDDCLRPPGDAARAIDAGMYGGTPHEVAVALTIIARCVASRPAVMPSIVPPALLRMGQPGRALQSMAAAPNYNQADAFNTLWSPLGRDARRLPEFPAFAREMGFVDVWEVHGAPDLCRRRAPGDYVCE